MSRPLLTDQLRVDEKLSKEEAARVAMLASLAEAGRPIAAAARAVGINVSDARRLASRFHIAFSSDGPA